MVKSCLIIAIRNLKRNKLYTAINILGLAVGMTCCILILLFVQHELSYENFYPHADRIYRIVRETRSENPDPIFSPGTSGNLGPALKSDFPEIETTTRMWRMDDAWIRYEKQGFTQTLLMADASVLDLFALPLLRGDSSTVLETPYSILITQSLSRKIFGNQNPIGKVIHIEQRYAGGDYHITGILKDIPNNTFLKCDCLTATKDPEQTRYAWWAWKTTSLWRPIQTFIRLPEGYDPNALEAKLPDAMARYMGETIRAFNTYHLQPLKRIHLYSRQDYGFESNGDIIYIHLSSAIAFLILIIACINFTTLSTARSTERAREIGMRKVVGASKSTLTFQFLGEALFLSLVALLVALLFTILTLPTFNAFMGKHLALNLLNGPILSGLLGLVLCVGILSGLYPAFFLSAFQPAQVIKGSQKVSARGTFFRKGLVVFQFAISISLIVSTLVIDEQLAYVQNKNLGFNKSHLVVLPFFLRDRSLSKHFEAIKDRLLRHPDVLNATAILSVPGEPHNLRVVHPEGTTGDGLRMYQITVDEDFIDTFEIPLLQGRNLSKSDSTAFLLNEAAVKQLRWANPVGKQFEFVQFGIKGTVVGVVQDFHIGSLHSAIGPAFICKLPSHTLLPLSYSYLVVRIRPGNFAETLAFLKDEWTYYIPNQPFEYAFLDDRIEQLYNQEKRLEQMFSTFALLAIFVACLGILGLSAFTAEQRTKEIGIRKVLGANVPNLVNLLSKDFVKLLLIANVIAWPITYYTMDKWLTNFVYRIDLGIGVFILSGVLAFLVALLTVSLQTLKAVRSNPIDALRNE